MKEGQLKINLVCDSAGELLKKRIMILMVLLQSQLMMEPVGEEVSPVPE